MKFRRLVPPRCGSIADTLKSDDDDTDEKMIVLKVDGKEIALTEDQAFAYSDPDLRDLIATIRLAETGKLPEKVTATFLSRGTADSPSTVRDRLRRLALHGLVVRKEDKSYKLTDAGRQLADAILEEEKTPEGEER